MLTLTHASFATVDELFEFKANGIELNPFPGYSPDQWGIKAHNRPWIVNEGKFRAGQRVLEVGGGYSLLLEHLATAYGVDSWVIDDFGTTSGEDFWARWADPREYAAQHPRIHYVFERLGGNVGVLPQEPFHRIITVSTLEHVHEKDRTPLLTEIHRHLATGGSELHTIDVAVKRPVRVLVDGVLDWITPRSVFLMPVLSEVRKWIAHVAASGVRIAARIPNSWELLDRQTLVESPDVVYRFYPPNDSPKIYRPNASLLLIIQDI